MSSNVFRWLVVTLCGLTVLLVSPGCTSARSGSAKTKESGSAPVIEAYIEAVAPDEGWAGPKPLMVHVLAAESPEPVLTLTSGFVEAELMALALEAGSPAPKGLDSRELGGQLEGLIQALSETAADAPHCLGMLRVRLIRSDGSVATRVACRDRSAGARAAGQMLHRLVETLVLSHEAWTREKIALAVRPAKGTEDTVQIARAALRRGLIEAL